MKFKKLNKKVKTPSIAYKDDAGIDVYSPEYAVLIPRKQRQIKLGIAIELKKDEVAIMSERSGMAISHGITSIGNIIDAGYRGEISIILTTKRLYRINEGDKIGQIIICKLGDRKLEEVNKLSKSERDSKAHNSSGK